MIGRSRNNQYHRPRLYSFGAGKDSLKQLCYCISRRNRLCAEMVTGPEQKSGQWRKKVTKKESVDDRKQELPKRQDPANIENSLVKLLEKQKTDLVIRVLKKHPPVALQCRSVQKLRHLCYPFPPASSKGITQSGDHRIDCRHTGQTSRQRTIDNWLDRIREQSIGFYFPKQAE